MREIPEPRHKYGCKNRADHRGRWVVIVREANYSAFNGYRRTRSAYSAVGCPPCGVSWRTKAAYVRTLPDGGLS